MADKVLVLGGRGHIGSGVTQDLLAHTDADITITGRVPNAASAQVNSSNSRVHFLSLYLNDETSLRKAIAEHNLVIHCAGPFRIRDARVLKLCIEQGVNYLDVSDDRAFTKNALAQSEAAQSAGVTAIINTGVFPGISNSMVRQGAEQMDSVERIHLSYVVAGSGGAGVTVMRTTFLNLQHPFEAWIDGQWKQVKPYTERETVEFPAPFGPRGVYWFDMPECYTLADTFSAKTVVTKFGSTPDFYNHLTWLTAHAFPSALMQQRNFVETLSKISYGMTSVTDRFTGTGVAMRATIEGSKDGAPSKYSSSFAHDNAAIATGIGTGSIAQLILGGQLSKPGVWAVEQALPTDLFEQVMKSRKILIHQQH